MSKTEPHQPINPIPNTEHGFNPDYGYEEGFTKREYFAAMAMQGLCANTHSLDTHDNHVIAKYAVRQADALIAELNKTLSDE